MRRLSPQPLSRRPRQRSSGIQGRWKGWLPPAILGPGARDGSRPGAAAGALAIAWPGRRLGRAAMSPQPLSRRPRQRSSGIQGRWKGWLPPAILGPGARDGSRPASHRWSLGHRLAGKAAGTCGDCHPNRFPGDRDSGHPGSWGDGKDGCRLQFEVRSREHDASVRRRQLRHADAAGCAETGTHCSCSPALR